jgi:hypothetical protein
VSDIEETASRAVLRAAGTAAQALPIDTRMEACAATRTLMAETEIQCVKAAQVQLRTIQF